MPGNDGKMSIKEKELVAAWLNRHGFAARGGCPVCNDHKWVIGDHVVTPLMFSGDSVMIGGGTYPQVMVISQTCGYTFYVNAILCGIVDVSPIEASELAAAPTDPPGTTKKA